MVVTKIAETFSMLSDTTPFLSKCVAVIDEISTFKLLSGYDGRACVISFFNFASSIRTFDSSTDPSAVLG